MHRVAVVAAALLLAGCAQPFVAPASPSPPPAAPTPTTVTFAAGSLTATDLSQDQIESWQQRITAAAKAVQVAEVQPDWDGKLTVVLPATKAEFTANTGVAADAASAATTCAAGVSAIQINPAIRTAPDSWLTSTLVHEGVHAATASACVPPGESLGWAREGLAESVAASADAATAQRNRELVDAYLSQNDLPSAPPSEPESGTDYALAAVAVDAVREQLGTKADAFLRRATHNASGVTAIETAQVDRWYRAALRELEPNGR